MFFSAAHGTFSKIDHILEHKANLKKVEIIPCILSDHNKIKLGPNSKRSYRKHSNTWRLKNTLSNDQWVIKEIRREIKKFLESNKSKNTTYPNYTIRTKIVLR
jgi:hypothetical protein